MSCFPDCHYDDYYNEDFLNESSKTFLSGADWMLEQILNLFDNLDIYKSELTEVLKNGEEPAEDEVYSTTEELYKILTANTPIITNIIQDWADCERNPLVVGMIDGMDEEEYNTIRREVLAANKTKPVPKEYYNTIRYTLTGRKETNEE